MLGVFLNASYVSQVLVVVHSEDLRSVSAACAKRFKESVGPSHLHQIDLQPPQIRLEEAA
jgi:hypothetical protein